MPESTVDAIVLISTSWQALKRAEQRDERTMLCDCTVVTQGLFRQPLPRVRVLEFRFEHHPRRVVLPHCRPEARISDRGATLVHQRHHPARLVPVDHHLDLAAQHLHRRQFVGDHAQDLGKEAVHSRWIALDVHPDRCADDDAAFLDVLLEHRGQSRIHPCLTNQHDGPVAVENRAGALVVIASKISPYGTAQYSAPDEPVPDVSCGKTVLITARICSSAGV